MGQTLLPSEAWLYLCSQRLRAARELAVQFPSTTGVTQKLPMFGSAETARPALNKGYKFHFNSNHL